MQSYPHFIMQSLNYLQIKHIDELLEELGPGDDPDEDIAAKNNEGIADDDWADIETDEERENAMDEG